MQKYRKYKRKRSAGRQQWGGFLNRYDFAYAGTDTVNTAMKGSDNCAPKLISQTSTETDKIAEVRIKQAINSGGQQIQKIAPQIYVELLKTYTKYHSGYWEILANKDSINSNENVLNWLRNNRGKNNRQNLS